MELQPVLISSDQAELNQSSYHRTGAIPHIIGMVTLRLPKAKGAGQRTMPHIIGTVRREVVLRTIPHIIGTVPRHQGGTCPIASLSAQEPDNRPGERRYFFIENQTMRIRPIQIHELANQRLSVLWLNM